MEDNNVLDRCFICGSLVLKGRIELCSLGEINEVINKLKEMKR